MDAKDNSLLEKKRFTDEEINYLYTVEKTLNGQIVWESNKNNSKYFSQTAVSHKGYVFCELRLRYNIGNEIFFRLQTKRSHQLIRSYHYQENHKHENPDGTIAGSKHKHRLPEEYAYDVSDIDISNINRALIGFLDECNIKYDPIIDIVQLKRPFTISRTLNQFGGVI